MKRISKRVLAVMLISVLAFTLVACGKKATIVGTWTVTDSGGAQEEYVFNADGTGTHTLSGLDAIISIEYKTDGETLTISETVLGQKISKDYLFKLEEQKLTLIADSKSVNYNKK